MAQFIAIRDTTTPIVVHALSAETLDEAVVETAQFETEYAVYELDVNDTTAPVVFNVGSEWHRLRLRELLPPHDWRLPQ